MAKYDIYKHDFLELSVHARTFETRYTWGHECMVHIMQDNHSHLELLYDGVRKCTYYNRTWERYTYQTVIKNALKDLINNIGLDRVWLDKMGYKRMTKGRYEEFQRYTSVIEEQYDKGEVLTRAETCWVMANRVLLEVSHNEACGGRI